MFQDYGYTDKGKSRFAHYRKSVLQPYFTAKLEDSARVHAENLKRNYEDKAQSLSTLEMTTKIGGINFNPTVAIFEKVFLFFWKVTVTSKIGQ